MSETQINKDDALINKHLPPGAEEFTDDALFTRRELVAYLLAERTGMTWQEAADEMDITYGTYSGKMGNNVEEKKKKAKATVKLIELIEGSVSDE